MLVYLPTGKQVSSDRVFNIDAIVGCLCAGSGKSYTMMGSLSDDELKGIIPRLCDTLFDKIAEVAITS